MPKSNISRRRSLRPHCKTGKTLICANCGNPFYVIKSRLLRTGTKAPKFCSRVCAGAKSPKMSDSRNWKGNAATSTAKHTRAIKLYPELGMCEECSEVPATDRHHKDGDGGNNARSNVAFLCRRCHMIADGRLEKFRTLLAVPPQPAKPCQICGWESKPLRKGRCTRCSTFFRNHRVDRTPEHAREW